MTEIARGLITLGIEPGDRVAIFATTSAEWTLADCGALCAGAVVAPVYHTNSADECAYVLGHSGAARRLLRDAAQAAKIAQIREQCPQLEHVIMLDDDAEGDAITARASCASAAAETTGRTPSQPAGATASRRRPGHARLHVGHDRAAEGLHAQPRQPARHGAHVRRASSQIDETHSLYQFLPLAHVLARVAQAVVLSAGAGSASGAETRARIVDELAELAAHPFPGGPARSTRRSTAPSSDGSRTGRALQRALFALGAGARQRARGPVARRTVAQPHRDACSTGSPIGSCWPRSAASSAASCSSRWSERPRSRRELLEFFDACGVLVLEGYGLSESCAAATLNTPHGDALRHGRQAAAGDRGVDRRRRRDPDPRPARVQGLLQGRRRPPRQALTDDGWLRTGDLGRSTRTASWSITGRKKDLIITSSGKNITPVNIESALRERRYITEAVVFGDNRPYLVAMLTLDRDEAAKLAARLGIAADPATIAHDPHVRAEVQQEVDAVNAKLARIEQIKRFAILDHDLSQAGGELTPTLKVKRAFVYDKYADLFAGLYERGLAS